MLVSVIVPVYNTSKYLGQCLQSLEGQTFKDIEVICVNDGSTDGSHAVIEHFVVRDPRFKAIHKRNTGYGHSVNMGIRAARGKYIGIVESDDFAEPGMFQGLCGAAEQFQADFVKGNYNRYCESSPCPVEFEDMLGGFPYGQLLSPRECPKMFGVHPSVWASLYRKSFLEDNGIWFSETQGASYQDISFAFKVNASAARVCFIREAVLNYRVDNVGSSVHDPQKIFCVCDEMQEIGHYIETRAKVGAFNAGWLKQLHQVAAWVKYRNYVWNYHRLSLPYQYAFLLKAREELSSARQVGYGLGFWDDGEKETLSQMADSPDSFFQKTRRDYADPRLRFVPVLNHSFSMECFQRLIERCQGLYIYGAGQIGQRVLACLNKMGAGDKVGGFIVSKQGKDPRQWGGKQVMAFDAMQAQGNKDALIIVAMRMQFQYEVALKLQERGYKNILLVDREIKSWIYRNTDTDSV